MTRHRRTRNNYVRRTITISQETNNWLRQTNASAMIEELVRKEQERRAVRVDPLTPADLRGVVASSLLPIDDKE